MNKIERYISATAIIALASGIGVISLLASMMAYRVASYPYNTEGRYFNGEVVYQNYSWFGYGIMAFAGLVVTIFLAWFAYLLLFKPRTN